MDNKKEIPLEELQSALFTHAERYFRILSYWIDVLKLAFPDAEIINYYGSTSGRINGVLYEFIEGVYPINNTPRIIRSNNQLITKYVRSYKELEKIPRQ